MADDVGQGERSEEATQARREDFRKRGQVAQTKELATALFVFAALGCVFVLSKFFFKEIFELFQYTYTFNFRQGNIPEVIKFAGGKLLILVSPVLAIALIISVGSSLVQTGLLQVQDALSPDADRINPIEGLKRLLALKNIAEGIKAILKLIFIMAAAYFSLRSELPKLPFISLQEPNQIMQTMGTLLVKLFLGVGIAILFLALADYFFQRWDLENRMMMTKQEVKEEHKSREGDPLIKARIRKIQREVANRRMMEKVPKADVIITNPTHIAVALKYDATLAAPQLIAKGADLIAEKIKSLAKEHNIPVVENKPLARTIYKTLKLGQIIPRELFVAVAEVLSYVYKLKKKRVGR